MKEKNRLKKMKRNIRLYYLFRLFGSMQFVVPIFMLFLMEKGLTSFEIMLTQAVYTVTELLLTVPSGAFADKVGRKKTLLISQFLFASGWVLYGLAGSFLHILMVEMMFAVSSAAFHGTGEAFLYDTLAEGGRKKLFKKVMGNTYALQSAVIGVAAVCGGFLAKSSLALPFFATAFPACLSILPLFFMSEPVRTKAESGYWKLMKVASSSTWKHPVLRSVLYYSGASMFTGFMAFLLLQPLLTKKGLPVEYLGFAVLFMAVASSLGSKMSHRVEKSIRSRNMLLGFAAVKAVLLLLVYVATGYYLLVWFVLMDLAMGVAQPIVAEMLSRHSREEHRATVQSLSGFTGCLTFSLLSPLMGLYVDAYSEQQAFLLLTVVMAVFVARQLLLVALSGWNSRKANRA
ncbi:MFS transporter [Candidatus Woesearchaeota archaeon]|nr:MFS transporter [Candidatus Woesearchaeota archaeon]